MKYFLLPVGVFAFFAILIQLDNLVQLDNNVRVYSQSKDTNLNSPKKVAGRKCVDWIRNEYTNMKYHTQVNDVWKKRGKIVVEVFGTDEMNKSTGQLMTCVYDPVKLTLLKPSILDNTWNKGFFQIYLPWL